MTGQELKDKIIKSRIPFTEIAAKTGIAPQSLNSTFKVNDVRSNTIERIAEAMGVDMSYFYPTGNGITTTILSGDGSALATQNSTAQAGADPAVIAKLLDELSEMRKVNQQLMEKILAK